MNKEISDIGTDLTTPASTNIYTMPTYIFRILRIAKFTNKTLSCWILLFLTSEMVYRPE